MKTFPQNTTFWFTLSAAHLSEEQNQTGLSLLNLPVLKNFPTSGWLVSGPAPAAVPFFAPAFPLSSCQAELQLANSAVKRLSFPVGTNRSTE